MRSLKHGKSRLTRRDGPTALALTRQNVPIFDRSSTGSAAGLARGAYVLASFGKRNARYHSDGVGIRGGSDLRGGAAAVEPQGISARVVSFPSWELFEQQSDEYRESVLPRRVTARIAVEAAVEPGLGALRGSGRAGLWASSTSAHRHRTRPSLSILASPWTTSTLTRESW